MSAWNLIQMSLSLGAMCSWVFGGHDAAWFMLASSALMELAEINEAIRAQRTKGE